MEIFSVSQFVEFLNTALSTAVFPDGVAIEGEVTEHRVSQDKWIWFQLKDPQSIVSCFATVWQLRTPLEDGMQVRVFGAPKVYPKSGKFSVTVERVELVGEGALRRAFELMKKKLADEGLFAAERKRPIPRFPERIGLIASRESAAYSDFLRILGNRWGGVQVRSADVSVQGRDAVREICSAFAYFNAHPESAEALVLTRGGGSLEDLQAFNSEEVARAVFASKIPVVVGVGHERDESLADYVADVRASTPSNAAELVAPDRREMLAAVDGGRRRIVAAMRGAVSERALVVRGLTERIESRAGAKIAAFRHRLKDFGGHFAAFVARTESRASAVAGLAARLSSGAGLRAESLGRSLDAKERMLRSLDPRRLLERGYALVRSGGKVLKDAARVDIGERVDVQLFRGNLVTEVKEKL